MTARKRMVPTGFLLVGRTGWSVEERLPGGRPDEPGLRRNSLPWVSCLSLAVDLQGAEADPSGLVLRDLDVRELVGRHEHPAALLVLEGEDAEVGLERVGNGLLDLLGGLAALQHELA